MSTRSQSGALGKESSILVVPDFVSAILDTGYDGLPFTILGETRGNDILAMRALFGFQASACGKRYLGYSEPRRVGMRRHRVPIAD